MRRYERAIIVVRICLEIPSGIDEMTAGPRGRDWYLPAVSVAYDCHILETDESEVSRVLKEAKLGGEAPMFWKEQQIFSKPTRTSCRRRTADPLTRACCLAVPERRRGKPATMAQRTNCQQKEKLS